MYKKRKHITVIHYALVFMLLPILSVPAFCAAVATIDDAKLAIRSKQFTQAAEALLPLAIQGDKEAQYLLATLYRSGYGVDKNHAKAVELLLSAAGQNHPSAQYNLGVMYEQGWGTKPNRALAKEWFEKAQANGHRMAKRKLKMINTSENTAILSLHHLASNGSSLAVQEYLSRNGNINALDNEGRSALFSAIEHNNNSVAAILIKANIDNGIVDIHSDTALLFACRRGNLSAIRLLLQKQPLLTATDNNGNTALHIAAAKGNAALVELLAEKLLLTPPRLQINQSGLTALDLAQRRKHKDVIAIFKRHGYMLNSKQNNTAKFSTTTKQPFDGLYQDWPSLNIAAWQGNKGHLLYLLKKGARIEQTDPEKYTSLARATIKKRIDIVKILLNKGANPSFGAAGKTALYLAAGSGQSELFLMLLENSTPSQTQLNSLLLKSSITDTDNIIQHLISDGAEINVTNKQTETALMVAAKSNNVSAMQALVQAGATLDAQDSDGNTALSLAIISLNTKGVKVLIHAGAAINIQNYHQQLPLHLAAKNGQVASINELLLARTEADARSESGNTALIIAARNGHTAVTQLLLQQKADINAQNKFGNSALMLAAAAGHKEVVKLLLEKNAETNLRNLKRETVYELAANLSEAGISQQLNAYRQENKWGIDF